MFLTGDSDKAGIIAGHDKLFYVPTEQISYENGQPNGLPHSVRYLGRVLLGLFRNRNTWNRRYLYSFGSYSVFGMNGISFRSFCSDSRMKRMEGIRFTRNTQNTRSFGKFLAGNPTRPFSPIAPGRHGSAQVTSATGIPFPDLGAFFSKLKFRVFCYS